MAADRMIPLTFLLVTVTYVALCIFGYAAS
jgi:hypothetical protein